MKSGDLVELTWWGKKFGQHVDNCIGIIIDIVECSGDVRCEIQWPDGTKGYHDIRYVRNILGRRH